MENILSLLWKSNETINTWLTLYRDTNAIDNSYCVAMKSKELMCDISFLNKLEDIKKETRVHLDQEFENGYHFVLSEVKRELGTIVDDVSLLEDVVNYVKIAQILTENIKKLNNLSEFCSEIDDCFEKLELKNFVDTPYIETFNEIGKTITVVENDISTMIHKYKTVVDSLNSINDILFVNI